jgi:hypothetical protein
MHLTASPNRLFTVKFCIGYNFFPSQTESLAMKTDKKEILRELLLSENRGFVLSIKLTGDNRPIKTAVRHVEHNKIILQPTCIFGHRLERTVLTLMDIEGVTRYKVLYDSPVYESIRMIKDNIRIMRDRIGAISTERQFQ